MTIPYFNEFVGTFIFIFAILCITSIKDLPLFQMALAIGLALTLSIMLACGLSIDAKAHFNPLVSLVMPLHAEFGIGNAVIFIIIQIIAAFLALGVFKLGQMETIEPFKIVESFVINGSDKTIGYLKNLLPNNDKDKETKI